MDLPRPVVDNILEHLAYTAKTPTELWNVAQLGKGPLKLVYTRLVEQCLPIHEWIEEHIAGSSPTDGDGFLSHLLTMMVDNGHYHLLDPDHREDLLFDAVSEEFYETAKVLIKQGQSTINKQHAIASESPMGILLSKQDQRSNDFKHFLNKYGYVTPY